MHDIKYHKEIIIWNYYSNLILLIYMHDKIIDVCHNL